jgi:flagellar hook-associated protein 2
VQTGATEFRMVLTSTATGKSGAFAIDGSKMVDGDSASVHFGSTNAVDASDADVLVNNVEIKSSSNTLDGLVPGLTLTVYKKTAPDSSVSVDLAPDVTNLKSQVNAFITSYNSLHAFSASMVSAATNGDPTSIAHDPMFRSVMQAVRGSLNGSYGTGTFNYLAQVGVEFQTDGTLKMNDAVWNDAVSQDPQGVAALIGGDGHSGAIAQFSSTLKAYTDSNGLFTTETTQFTTELSNLAQQISDMTDRLNQQRTQMQAEFTAADQAMTDLKTQSGALASFGSTVNSSISSSTSNLSTSTL